MIDTTAYTDEKRIRATAAASSLFLHIIIAIIVSLTIIWQPKQLEPIELDWAGSSGAPNQSITQSENEPNRALESAQSRGAAEKSKIDIPEVKSPSEEIIPSAKKEKPKTTAGRNRERTKSEGSTTTRHRRAKDGLAGGAGKSTGYSIEWSGAGSRRLLSGRIPRYPEGTNKELPVTLQFSVLPDGSVTGIIPLYRSDELLEREAISALQTWRFDPLPPQFEQKSQNGKITFKFVLQKE
ncbi:MAG: TonB family protein [Ignavibacteriales bacterium]|nr:TonB family protein [Ignavibacteriales bacterium]